MADLIHLGNIDVVIQKDKPGSPTGCSDDGNLGGLGGMSGLGMMAAGGIDLGDLAQELDHDEFDGPHMLNGKRNIEYSFNLWDLLWGVVDLAPYTNLFRNCIRKVD